MRPARATVRLVFRGRTHGGYLKSAGSETEGQQTLWEALGEENPAALYLLISFIDPSLSDVCLSRMETEEFIQIGRSFKV